MADRTHKPSRRTFLKFLGGTLTTAVIPVEAKALGKLAPLDDVATRVEEAADWAYLKEEARQATELHRMLVGLGDGVHLERLPLYLGERGGFGRRMAEERVLAHLTEGAGYVRLEGPSTPWSQYIIRGLDLQFHTEGDDVLIVETFAQRGGANMFAGEFVLSTPSGVGPGLRYAPHVNRSNAPFLEIRGRGRVMAQAIIERTNDDAFSIPRPETVRAQRAKMVAFLEGGGTAQDRRALLLELQADLKRTRY